MTIRMVLQEDGRVALKDGNWRGIVEPHDSFTLDALWPDIPAEDRQTIETKWATIPVPDPEMPQPPPNPADMAEGQMKADPFMRAWVKRQAAKEGKTPRQIMDEIRNNT